MIVNKNHYKNISEYVYLTLKEMILTLKVLPLSKLSEVKMSELLQTSKTPVREAFVKLSEEGLVRILPQRGTVVSPIESLQVEEGRFVRRAVEVAVLKKMMEESRDKAIIICGEILDQHQLISPEDFQQQFYYDFLFHQEIYKLVGMMKTWDMLTKMNADYTRIRYLVLEKFSKNDSILQEHNEIYQNICDNNVDGVIQSSLNHLDRWNQEKDIVINNYKHFFLD